MARLISYFLRGLVFVVPIALTLWVVIGVFGTADAWARQHLGLPIPGLGVVVLVAATIATGFLASNFLTKRLMRGLERTLDRLPVVKLLHGSLKDLLSAFVGEKRRFDKPVVVAMNADGTVKALGFITREDLTAYQQPDCVAVYFPQAYNFAGQVAIVPRTSVTHLDLPPSDVMTFIVSGGISGR